MKTIKFKINGIHCQSCEAILESEIKSLAGVASAKVDYQKAEAEVVFDETECSQEKIFSSVKKVNYAPVEEEGMAAENNDSGFLSKLGWEIYLFVFVLIAGLSFLKYMGGFEFMAALNEKNIGYGLIFIIGFFASFHCVGMCGGLIVSYCSGEIKNGGKTDSKAHLKYNAGRIISYTIIGAILGGLGSFFGINPFFTGTITLLAGFFMVLMGLSLAANFSWLEKIKLRTPDFIARLIYTESRKSGRNVPFYVGLLTGFMPCGPLQAMQLYALGSGEAAVGALSMFFYALGTTPLLFGFGSAVASLGGKNIKNILKLSGALVLVLGLLMIGRGLGSFGFAAPAASNGEEKTVGDFQTVRMDLTYLGYKPNVLYIKPEEPVRWIINVKEMTGCTDAIMIESLGIKKDLKYGENIIEFTPPKGVKEIKFSCWMRMVWGKFIVTDGDSSMLKIKEAQAATGDGPVNNGSCGAGGCGCGCGSDGNKNKDGNSQNQGADLVSGSCH